MKKRNIAATLILAALYSTSNAAAGDKVSWGYSGKEGPEYWGSLDPEFSLCSEGKNQSPINLTGMIEGDLLPITISYQAGGNEILNDGHAIQVNYSPGSTIKIDGHQFELKQFHFHSPSENTIEGRSFPMEAHFVHMDKQGNLAVIAQIFKAGGKNLELEKTWSLMPEKPGETNVLPTSVDAKILLPAKLYCYRFNGSLTTPPCSEGVWWFVMKRISSRHPLPVPPFSDIACRRG